MTGNGHFGVWFEDNFGLPAYEYNCNQDVDPLARTPTTYGFSKDHYHQLGNDKITATAHNGGYVQVLEGSRGFQWLNLFDKKNNCFGGGVAFIYDEKNHNHINDLYNPLHFETSVLYKRVFGMGYFQKVLQSNDIQIEHNICIPFSDDPVVISEIIVSNTSKTENLENLQLFDYWGINLNHILKSLIVSWNGRKKYGASRKLNFTGKLVKFLQKIVKKDTDGSRKKFDKNFEMSSQSDINTQTISLEPKYKKNPPFKPNEAAEHNFYPKNVFLSMIEGKSDYAFTEQNKLFNNENPEIQISYLNDSWSRLENSNIENPCLILGTRLSLKPGDSQKIICIFGYANEDEKIDLIKKYQTIIKENSILEWNASKWKSSLIEFDVEGVDWLLRESKWHSYYTRSSSFFDEYYNLHRFPQGSVYLFGHGFDGAIRDFMLYLLAIIHINPKLAKEYLTLNLSFMSPEGKLPYGFCGFGKTLSASVHSKPSDLYLFLLWGIIQYIYSTRDFDFLNIEVPLYPKTLNKSSKVIDKIKKLITFFFSENVGFGQHDLIKCNDGDWNDGISFMIKKRKKFLKYGESNFNSTFALYLLPKIIPLLKEYSPELVQMCQENILRLKKGVFATWNGNWFYRGYDGLGNPIGDTNISLEHHTWLLLSEILPKEQIIVLLNNIYEKLDANSPIGQYLSYPPQRTLLGIFPEGWDVNGGVWHAMNNLLTWAYSKYDLDKAYNSLIKNSLHQRAEQYPNIWYGIWSGPDSYIANYAEDAGQAFYHFTTPMRDFPLMNLNAHACYLYSIVKMAGIEEEYDSIIIGNYLKKRNYSFKSQLYSIDSTEQSFSLNYSPVSQSDFTIKIEKPSFFNEDTTVQLNGESVRNKPELFKEETSYLEIRISSKCKEIAIKIYN